MIGNCSFTFSLAILLRLAFRIIYLAKVEIDIHFLFCVAGCAMVIHRSCLVGLLDYLGDCEWLCMLGHAMVNHTIRLVLCNHDLLVGWLAIFTRFLCCNSNSLVLSGRTVIRLLLGDADSLSWFDCLLNDNCFLFRLRCVHDS